MYPKDATAAEMQRLREHPHEPPVSDKAFPVAHYPANPDLYSPGFEVFVWTPPKRPEWRDRRRARPAGWRALRGLYPLVDRVDPIGKSVPEVERLLSSETPASITLIVDRDGMKKTFTFELAKASEVAELNHKRFYDGHLIPSVVPDSYLHCFAASKAP